MSNWVWVWICREYRNTILCGERDLKAYRSWTATKPLWTHVGKKSRSSFLVVMITIDHCNFNWSVVIRCDNLIRSSIFIRYATRHGGSWWYNAFSFDEITWAFVSGLGSWRARRCKLWWRTTWLMAAAGEKQTGWVCYPGALLGETRFVPYLRVSLNSPEEWFAIDDFLLLFRRRHSWWMCCNVSVCVSCRSISLNVCHATGKLAKNRVRCSWHQSASQTAHIVLQDGRDARCSVNRKTIYFGVSGSTDSLIIKHSFGLYSKTKNSKKLFDFTSTWRVVPDDWRYLFSCRQSQQLSELLWIKIEIGKMLKWSYSHKTPRSPHIPFDWKKYWKT